MIKCYLTKNLKIINIGFTAKVDIDISLGTSYDLDANGSSKKSMVCNFFASISRTRCLAISRITVKVYIHLQISEYIKILSISFFFVSLINAVSYICYQVIKKLEPQLQFPYLSQFSASFSVFDLKVLPIILWSCPKLKSLILVKNSSNLFYNIVFEDCIYAST